ncbi:MAG: HD domain-containing protein, partial [Promethearchaeota archaeon]
IAGALLHDVGKLVEYSKNREKIGTSITGKLLRHPGLGLWLVKEVQLSDEIGHIVMCHSWEGDRADRLIESIIVNKCDFIHFETKKRLVKQNKNL